MNANECFRVVVLAGLVLVALLPNTAWADPQYDCDCDIIDWTCNGSGVASTENSSLPYCSEEGECVDSEDDCFESDDDCSGDCIDDNICAPPSDFACDAFEGGNGDCGGACCTCSTISCGCASLLAECTTSDPNECIAYCDQQGQIDGGNFSKTSCSTIDEMRASVAYMSSWWDIHDVCQTLRRDICSANDQMGATAASGAQSDAQDALVENLENQAGSQSEVEPPDGSAGEALALFGDNLDPLASIEDAGWEQGISFAEDYEPNDVEDEPLTGSSASGWSLYLNYMLNQSPANRPDLEKADSGEIGDQGDDPIDFVSGALVESVVDVRLPSLGFDYVVKRTYRSRLNYDGPFGHGWTSPDFEQIWVNILAPGSRNGTVTRLDGNGGIRSYMLEDSTDILTPMVDSIGDMGTVLPLIGEFVFTSKDGSWTIFDSDYLVRSHINRAGHEQTYGERNENGDFDVTDTLGRRYRYSFDEVAGKRRLTSVESGDLGTLTSYSYDVHGRLQEQRHHTQGQWGYSDDVKTQYIYASPYDYEDLVGVSSHAIRSSCRNFCGESCFGVSCSDGCEGDCYEACSTSNSECEEGCDCSTLFDCEGACDTDCESVADSLEDCTAWKDDFHVACIDGCISGYITECESVAGDPELANHFCTDAYGSDACDEQDDCGLDSINCTNIREATKVACTNACELVACDLSECDDACVDACGDAQFSCDLGCGDECDGYGSECKDGCEDGCYWACIDDHDRFYGGKRDVQHNLIGIVTPNASENIHYLENQYGVDPTDISFDRIVYQRYGDRELDITYRELTETEPSDIAALCSGLTEGMFVTVQVRGYPQKRRICADPRGLMVGVDSEEWKHPVTFRYDDQDRKVERFDTLLQQRTVQTWDGGLRRSNNLLSVVVESDLMPMKIKQAWEYEEDYNLPIKHFNPRAFVSTPNAALLEDDQLQSFNGEFYSPNHVTTITYDHQDPNSLQALGVPTTIQKPATAERDGMSHQLQTHFEYNVHGLLSSQEQGNGAVVHYAYYDTSSPYGQQGEPASPDYGGMLALTYVFDDDGRRLETQYRYDSMGQLQSVEHPDGRTQTFAVDTIGRLQQVTENGEDGLQRGVRYDLDLAGRPLSMALNLSPSATLDGQQHTPSNIVTEYAWNQRNEKIKSTQYVDGQPRVLSFSYHPDGSMHLACPGDNCLNYPSNNPDGLGMEWSRRTNDFRKVYDRMPYVLDREATAMLEWDTAINQRSELSNTYVYTTGTTDAHESQTWYSSDILLGQTKLIEEADGTKKQLRHFLNGTLKSVEIQSSEGAILSKKEFEIGEDGLVLAERTLNLDSNGLNQENTWLERRFHYNNAGQPIRVDRFDASTSQLVTESSLQYDGLGRLKTTLLENGMTIERFYNVVGHLENVERRSPGEPGWSDAVEYRYDGFGRVIQKGDSTGSTWSYGYTHTDQLAFQIGPDGRRTDWVYNEAGETLRTIWADGNTVEYSYDHLGRLASMDSERDKTTTWSWNDQQRQRTVTYPSSISTTHIHNTRGVLESVVHSDGRRTDILNRDAVGRVTQRQHTSPTSNPINTSYNYDGLSRILSATLNDGVNELTTELTYTTLGQLERERTTGTVPGLVPLEPAFEVSSSAVFDGVGRLKTLRYGDHGGNPNDVHYTYNAAGQLEGIAGLTADVWDGSRHTKRNYLRTGLEENYTYSPRGEYAGIALTGPCASESFCNTDIDCSGSSLCQNNGCYEAECSLGSNPREVLWGERWLRYPSGNVRAKWQMSHDGLPDYTEHFEYDPRNRLTGVERSDAAPNLAMLSESTVNLSEYDLSYQFDGSGNVLNRQVDGDVWVGQYNDNNSLAQFGKSTDVQAVSNTAWGAVSGVHHSGFDLDSTWDATDQMREVTVNNVTGEFVYDAFGRLAASKVDGKTHFYSRLGDTVMYRTVDMVQEPFGGFCNPIITNCSGEIATEGRQLFVYDGQRQAPIWASVPFAVGDPLMLGGGLPFLGYNVHSDMLGSVRALSSDPLAVEGSLVAREDYGPYGDRASHAGPTLEGVLAVTDLVPFGYAGLLDFPDLQMVQMGARWYSTSLQRFMSPDPMGYIDGSNRFSYVGGNPLRWVDPSGFSHTEPSRGSASIGRAHESSGVRNDRDGSLRARSHYNNAVAGMYADFGFIDFAELLEAGHACAGCHVSNYWWGQTGGKQGFIPQDENINLDQFNRVSVGSSVLFETFIMAAPAGGFTRAKSVGSSRSVVGLHTGSSKALLNRPLPKELANKISHVDKRSRSVGVDVDNCLGCAIATDRSLAGHKAFATPQGPVRIGDLLSNYPNRSLTRQGGALDIEMDLLFDGNGARGIVQGLVSGGEKVIGGKKFTNHTFNVINVNETVIFYDAKTMGRVDPDIYDALYLMRTD